MSDDAVSWIGGLATLAAGCVYAFMAMYNRKQSTYRLPLWLLVPAFFFAVQQFAQLRDIGTYARPGDGINYNYFRVAGFFVSDLFAGAALMAYLWHDYANGWTVVLYGAAASASLLISGLFSDDARFVVYGLSEVFRFLSIFYLVWRTWFGREANITSARRMLPDGPEATWGRRLAMFICILGYEFCQVGFSLFHILGWDMSR